MSTLLIVVGCLVLAACYLVAGHRMGVAPAARYIERRLDKDRSLHPSLASDKEWIKERRDRYREESVSLLWIYTFFWPIALPFRALGAWDRAALDRHDPAVQAQLFKDQQKRIAELERELGI